MTNPVFAARLPPMSKPTRTIALVLITTASCTTGTALSPKVDGGTSPDGKTATADALPVGPTTLSPDTRLPEPGVAPDLQTAGLPDARPADIRVSIPDGAGTDLAPAREVGSAVDLRTQGEDTSPLVREVGSVIDLRTQGEDTPQLVLVDARDAQGSVDLRIVSPDVSDIDTPRDLGAPDIEADARTNWDVGTSFGGVIVYVKGDLAPVDSTCAAGEQAWLAAIQAALPQARGCLLDDDCMYASFNDDCGNICAMPLSRFRIGEFGSRVSTYPTHTCATCPEVLDILDGCSAPGTVVCRAGQCEYQ
jgi:hypothetical protein